MRLVDLLHAGRQLALGARRPAERLVVVAAVLLAELGLLGQVAPLDLGDALVVLLVARLQLRAAPPLGGVQLGDAPLLVLDDVALPALLGRGQLLLVAAPHAQDLVAVVALLGLGERLVGLALRGELQPLLFLAGGDRLLVLAPQARRPRW